MAAAAATAPAGGSNTAGSELLRSWAHDINCLSDESWGMRKEGFERLRAALNHARRTAQADTSKRSVFEFAFSGCLDSILKRFHDPKEKIRDIAVDTCLELFDTANWSGQLPRIVAVVQTRFVNNTNNKEPEAEEIRLKLLEFVSLLIAADSGSIVHCLDKLSSIFTRTGLDLAPALKLATAAGIKQLAALTQSSVLSVEARSTHFSGLIKTSCLPNLKHQQWKVRRAALQAIGALIKNSGGTLVESTREILPELSPLAFDRAPQVREALIEEVSEWLTALHPSPKERAPLIVMLLSMCADEVDSIRIKAAQTIDTIARTIAFAAAIAATAATAMDRKSDFDTKTNSSATNAASSSSTVAAATVPANSGWVRSDLAKPFTSRPSTEARQYVSNCCADILPLTITQLTDWTASTRIAAVNVLHALLLYAESDVSSCLDALIPAYCKAVRDENAVFRAQLTRCMALTGHFVPPQPLLNALLPAINGGSDTPYRVSCLTVFGALLDGMTNAAAATTTPTATTAASSVSPLSDLQLESVLQCMAGAEVGEVRVRYGVFRCMETLLRVCPPSQLTNPGLSGRSPFADTIFSILLQLDAKAALPAEETEAVKLMTAFGDTELKAVNAASAATATSKSSASAAMEVDTKSSGSWTTGGVNSYLSASTDSGLAPAARVYARHFGVALRTILGSSVMNDVKQLKWTSDSFDRIVFFTLLKRSVLFLSDHFETVLPVLVWCADTNRDPLIRVSSLGLLHQLLEAKAVASFLVPHSLLLVIRDILIPNCVWRSGKVASALRLQTFVVLNQLFANRLIDAKLLTGSNTATAAAAASSAGGLRAALVAPLQSNLDDEELAVRLEVLRALTSIFALSGGDGGVRFPDEKSTTDLYAELLKRFDDSNDTARLEAMRALGLFVTRGFPPAAEYDPSASQFTFIVRTSIVHLDDTNPQIRAGAYELLSLIAGYNPAVLLQEVASVKSKHRDPTLAEQLRVNTERLFQSAKR